MAAPMRLNVTRAVLGMGAAVAVVAVTWLAIFHLAPEPPAVLSSPGPLIASALGTAALLTVVLMIEAIAHERLVTDAFNPLAGHDSDAMKVNQRVLQNSVEQYLVYAAGIVMLGTLFEPALAYRAVLATTLNWIGSRWLFWIGYRISPQNRVAGLVGAAQSMIVLLVTLWILGGRIWGPIGAALVPSLFGLGEFAIAVKLVRARQQ